MSPVNFSQFVHLGNYCCERLSFLSMFPSLSTSGIIVVEDYLSYQCFPVCSPRKLLLPKQNLLPTSQEAKMFPSRFKNIVVEQAIFSHVRNIVSNKSVS